MKIGRYKMSQSSKKYIILTPRITGMGGGQQYTYNKMRAMQSLGYQVVIFSTENGEVIIPAFREYLNGVIAELMFQPMFFGNSKRNQVVSLMLRLCGSCSEDTIIETMDQATSQWGEMLAKEIECVHLIHFITENPHAYSSLEVDYYLFKLSRKELLFNSRGNCDSLFFGYYSVNDEEFIKFSPQCTNVVGDVDSELSRSLPCCDYNICSIGRLEKPYVFPMVQTLRKYIAKHPTQKFNVILIGGSDNNRVVSKIRREFAYEENCRLFITGNMYPIPRMLVEKMDLFISSSGSTRVSAGEGKVTIRIPYDTSKPCFVRFNEEKCIEAIDADDDLEKLIKIGLSPERNRYVGSKYLNNSVEPVIQEHHALLSQIIDNAKEYYDISRIKPRGIIRIIEAFCGRVLGGRGLRWLIRHKH